MPARRPKPSHAASAATLALVEAKLAESGLTLDDMPTYGFVPLDGPAATQRLGVEGRAGLLLPYLDPITGDDTGYWRYRFLEPSKGFAAQTKRGQDGKDKYRAPKGEPPHVYFPAGCDWPDLFEDDAVPLIITEGELKATACWHLTQSPCIGLGGVSSWQSKNSGQRLLKDLELIKWAHRHVYVCYDSDYRQNPDVLTALNRLSEALGQLGAIVHVVSLPDPKDDSLKKLGLDDFLVHEGPDQLNAVLRASNLLGLTTELMQYNERYAYVMETGFIVDLQSRQPIMPAAFTGHRHANQTCLIATLAANGEVRYEKVAAGKAWLEWGVRREATRLTFRPGHPVQVDGCINTWQGWGVEPAPGDPSLFLKLVDHLFTGADPGAKEWFLRWCAYPLQYPGAKLASAVVLYGIKHGTGKTLLGQTLMRFYGRHAVEISHRDLEGSFNEWQVNKQFVVGDDITGADKRQDADYLKKLITQQQVTINQKFLPTYVMPDCMNYFFTSNHPDAFFLEDDDRRLFVQEVAVGQLDEDFYADYALWLDTEGAPAVFHHLLHLDLGDFNPSGRAFQTGAKTRMTDDGRSDLASWVRLLRDDPDAVLRVGKAAMSRDLYTTQELLGMYGDTSGKVTATGLGRELARAGFQQVLQGKPLRVPDRPQARYYICRGADKWLKATQAQVVKHLASK